MAIFANDNKQPNGTGKMGPATIIAQGTKLKGEIHIDCHLHIDGEFEGNIHSKNTVMIGKTGLVSGEIYAQKLIVSGKFNGTTESEVVEILPLGRIDGKIISSELVIERKGIFMGESKTKQNAMEKPQKISNKLNNDTI
ncbi:polymer-forming cytoskeletal family protein [Helicobacter sp. 12S02232-10]|uniref:bactofilin family protein n=1 Tax=Helicobacter sp. 12S02232-10 TaxID=1476197 RepID=UPI000BA5DFD8|nr:polymer-forming cytoskeletal protein [Helicobacter sp. 12S02232-10]PAF48674.1 polymer-forming cytoskeletal family protein [Helicobacter sp. 12S02232-10]